MVKDPDQARDFKPFPQRKVANDGPVSGLRTPEQEHGLLSEQVGKPD